jgi:hypothetical protein
MIQKIVDGEKQLQIGLSNSIVVVIGRVVVVVVVVGTIHFNDWQSQPRRQKGSTAERIVRSFVRR